MLGDVHAVEHIVGPRCDILDQLVSSWGKSSSCCLAHDALHHEEAEISLDAVSTEKEENVLHHISVLCVLHYGQLACAVVEGLSLSIGQSQLLHQVGGLSHQNVVGTNLRGQGLVCLHELLEENRLSELEQVRKEL